MRVIRRVYSKSKPFYGTSCFRQQFSFCVTVRSIYLSGEARRTLKTFIFPIGLSSTQTISTLSNSRDRSIVEIRSQSNQIEVVFFVLRLSLHATCTLVTTDRRRFNLKTLNCQQTNPQLKRQPPSPNTLISSKTRSREYNFHTQQQPPL